MTTTRLLCHDLLLIQNGLADVLGSWRDRLLLGTFAAIGLGWLINSHPVNAPTWPNWVPGAILVIMAVAAAGTMQAASSRLRDFVDGSALCADALDPPTRLTYKAVALTPVLIASLLVASVVEWDGRAPSLWPLAVAAALFFGAVIPGATTAIGRLFRTRRVHATEAQRHNTTGTSVWSPHLAVIIAGHQTMMPAKTSTIFVVPSVLALAVAVFAAVIARTAGNIAGVVALGVPALGALLLLTRVDDQLVRFTAFTGRGPLISAGDHLIVAGIFCVVVTPAELALTRMPSGDLLVILIVALAFASVAVARVWYYRTRSRRAANLAIQLDLSATALLGSAFPPLAAGWLVLRLTYLYRAARAATWAVP